MRVLSLLALILGAATANAKITTVFTLNQIVEEQKFIFTAKVTEFLPDKPGMVIAPVEQLRGEFAFDRVPVNLKGDEEATKEKQTAMLLERLDKDVPLIVFANRRGANLVALAYTNGTWIRMSGRVEKDGEKEVTRWQLAHCEPYFRRAFKGTTEELIKVIKGGLKGEKLPAYNEKEEPGYGPPLKKAGEEGKKPPSLPFGVIQLPFLGLIVALAALFPTVFGGAAVLMKRWVAALSVASFVSILAALGVYFPHWIGWTGLKSLSSVWVAGGVLAGLGALWAGYRYRRANRDGRTDEFQPRYMDRIGLAVIVVLILGTLAGAYAFKENLRETPWLELVVLLPPLVTALYYIVSHRLRNGEEPRPVAVSAETVSLWAGAFACVIAGVSMMGGGGGPAIESGGGSAHVKLVEQPLWVFEPKEKGEILSTPCVTPDAVFVAVHHRQGFDQYGRVYALNPANGDILWKFDDQDNLKPVFCSPVYADGKLYFGEGYHTDRDSKLFCLNATNGEKVWEFKTTSHTESTPAIADGKVVFGAGDDGLYCLDSASGQKLWQYPAEGGLHIDSNPAIHEGRVYAGSGTSMRSKANRLFAVDLKTGAEAWGENVEYSAWGSPTVAGKQAFFVTGNGTFSGDREPIAGMVLCRDAATGKPIWERPLANSIVTRPAVDRYQVYVGCRDGNCYALERHSGEVVWSKTLQSPVLASLVIEAEPKIGNGVVLYGIGSAGQLEALSPADGSLYWAINFRSLIQTPHVNAVSTPVIQHIGEGQRRVYIGLGFGPSAVATPTARLYCFLSTAE